MRRLNKKGILMPETLKILIAVLSIVILVYLAASLFGILRGQYKTEQAKSHLEQLSIVFLNLQNNTNKTYLLTNPKDWMLISFPLQNPKEICFCPETSDTEDKAANYLKCKTEGICKLVDSEIKILGLNNKRMVVVSLIKEIFISKAEDKIFIFEVK